MRFAIAALILTLVAAPALAGGRGHALPKPASEQPVSVHGAKETIPKNSPMRVEDSHLKPGYEKSLYEKRLNATQREYKQTLSGKLRGLHHAPGELDLTSEQGEASKGRAAATLQGEAPQGAASQGGVRQGGGPQGGAALSGGARSKD